METGKEDSTFRQESRQEMAKHAPCTSVSGAQGFSQGAQGSEKRGDQGDAALASSGSVEWLLWMEGALGNSEANGHCGSKDCVEVEAPRNQPSHVAVDVVRVRQKPDGLEGGQGSFSDAEDEAVVGVRQARASDGVDHHSRDNLKMIFARPFQSRGKG
jgi:hypothetical protein